MSALEAELDEVVDATVEVLTDAQQALVLDNVALVYTVAKRYGGIPYVQYQDLVSRLQLRLCVAIARYDPTRGYRISPYVVRSLEGEAKNFFRDEVWMVRPPRKLRDDWTAANRAYLESDSDSLGGENPAVIASCASPVDLHAPLNAHGDSPDAIGDWVPDPQVNVEAEVVARLGGDPAVRQLFRWLTPPERYALALTMNGRPRQRFARRYRLSGGQTCRVYAELLAKVRRAWFAILDGDPLPENPGSETLMGVDQRRADALESARPENRVARRRHRQRLWNAAQRVQESESKKPLDTSATRV